MGNREEDVLPGKKLILQVIFGALKGLIISVILAAVLSLAVSGGILPADKALAMAIFCTLTGSFAGSFFAVRKHREKRWLLGLAVGFCVFALLFVLGLVFSLPRAGVPQMLGATLLAGLLGGLPGTKRKHRSKR